MDDEILHLAPQLLLDVHVEMLPEYSTLLRSPEYSTLLMGPTLACLWGSFSSFPSHLPHRAYHLALFFSLSVWLRSRSPLALFELIYIYIRLTAVTYTQRRSRSIRSNFIPNDCTFGLFRLLPVRQDYIGRVRREMSFSLRSRWPGSSRSSLYRYRYIF